MSTTARSRVPDEPRLSKRELYANRKRQPKMLAVSPSGIPAELKSLKRWVLWDLKLVSGRWTKVPYQPDGRKADATSPRRWGPFGSVSKKLACHDGLGFVLGDGITGVDLDDVRNPNTEEVESWADELVNRLCCYCEVSPSRTGLKIFIRGRWKGTWHKRKHPSGRGDIEVYDAGRYFAVTGVGYRFAEVDRRQKCLDELAAMFPEKGSPAAAAPSPSVPTPPDDDRELLALIARSAVAAPFAKLWVGDTSDHNGDDSAADLALCNYLAF